MYTKKWNVYQNRPPPFYMKYMALIHGTHFTTLKKRGLQQILVYSKQNKCLINIPVAAENPYTILCTYKNKFHTKHYNNTSFKDMKIYRLLFRIFFLKNYNIQYCTDWFSLSENNVLLSVWLSSWCFLPEAEHLYNTDMSVKTVGITMDSWVNNLSKGGNSVSK